MAILTSIEIFVHGFQPSDVIVGVRYQMHVDHLIFVCTQRDGSAESEQQAERPNSHGQRFSYRSCDHPLGLYSLSLVPRPSRVPREGLGTRLI